TQSSMARCRGSTTTSRAHLRRMGALPARRTAVRQAACSRQLTASTRRKAARDLGRGLILTEIDTMRFLLAILLTWVGAVQPVVAASAATSSSQPVPAQAPFAQAQLMNYVLGDRTRLVQVTTIAFGIGVVILLTATRKR